jgi:hypothetical protein
VQIGFRDVDAMHLCAHDFTHQVPFHDVPQGRSGL